jgi:hypothetical protein
LVKIPRAVLQAVSQKRYDTKTRIRRRSAFRDHCALSPELVKALLWKWEKASLLMAEGKTDPAVPRASLISELCLADKPLPKSERMPNGDILDLGV